MRRDGDQRSAQEERTDCTQPPAPPTLPLPASQMSSAPSISNVPAPSLPAFYKQSFEARVDRHHRHDQWGRDRDPGDFPYRGRPGCSRCGDSVPTMLHRRPTLYLNLSGWPEEDSYKNVFVCTQCKSAKPAYDEMFSAVVYLHSGVTEQAKAALLVERGVRAEQAADLIEAEQRLQAVHDKPDQVVYDSFVNRLPESASRSLRDGTAEPGVNSLVQEHVSAVIALQVKMATASVDKYSALLAATDKRIADFSHVQGQKIAASIARQSDRHLQLREERSMPRPARKF